MLLAANVSHLCCWALLFVSGAQVLNKDKSTSYSSKAQLENVCWKTTADRITSDRDALMFAPQWHKCKGAAGILSK